MPFRDISIEEKKDIIAFLSCRVLPSGAFKWGTVSKAAKDFGVSRTTVHNIWRDSRNQAIKQHRITDKQILYYLTGRTGNAISTSTCLRYWKTLPDFKSQYFPPSSDGDVFGKITSLLQMFAKNFIRQHFYIGDSVLPVKSVGKQPPEYNYQILRLFFAERANSGRYPDLPEHLVERFLYEAEAAMTTYEFDIVHDGLKVRPFSPVLQLVVDLFAAHVHKSNPSAPVDFNFLEIEIYLGEDMFEGIERTTNDEKRQPIKVHANNSLTPHCDFMFNVDSQQSTKDSAESDCPHLSFTVGSPCVLTFERYFAEKPKGKRKPTFKKIKRPKNTHNWVKQHRVEQELVHGSAWRLAVEDEIPALSGGFVYKTKHSVSLPKGKTQGVSMTFEFRKVKNTSTAVFHRVTNNVAWQLFDDERKKKLFEMRKNHKDKFSKVQNDHPEGKEIRAIRERMLSYLNTFKDVEL